VAKSIGVLLAGFLLWFPLFLAANAGADPTGAANKGGTANSEAAPQWLKDFQEQSQKSVDDFMEASRKLRPHWPEYETLANRDFSARCGYSLPTKDLTPTIVHEGHIDGWAASQTGVVAVADLLERRIIVFPDGIDGNPREIRMAHNGFKEGSVGVSANGHYVSWTDLFTDYIYDVALDKVVWQLDDEEGLVYSQQWIGDNLVIEEPRKGTLLLIKHVDQSFKSTTLSSRWDPFSPTIELARADQLGESFLGNNKVYHSLNEIETDGATAEMQDHVGSFGSNVLRAENRILIFRYPDSRDGKVLMELHDGMSGATLLSRPVASECQFVDATVTGDGASFAVLTGIESIATLDRNDLSTKLLYNLRSPSGTMAQPWKISFLPDGRILVSSREVGKSWLLSYDPRPH